jgi:hypothetical protein
MRYRTILAALFGSAALMIPFATSAQAATAGQIQFRLIQYNTPGPDLPVTNAKLNQEFVTLKNTGTTSRNLTGWTVEDLAGHVYTFGRFTRRVQPVHATSASRRSFVDSGGESAHGDSSDGGAAAAGATAEGKGLVVAADRPAGGLLA